MRLIRCFVVIAMLATLPKVIYMPFKAHMYQRKALCLCRMRWCYTLYNDATAKMAIPLLEKSLRYDCRNWKTYFLLGLVYSQLKEYERAEAAYLACLIFNLGHAKSYYNLGNVYYYLRRYSMAEQRYLDYLRIDPDFEGAKRNLEIVRMELRR